ncbi:MAG TPA: hypothetical protein VGO18_03505, partial [Steroidobacteraceae bacterium]|nr:hypothetical protein [Steroidobacteraceae bacterium]
MATRKAKRTAGGDADADKGKPGKRAKKSATRRTRGKLAPGTSARGLDAADVAIALDSPEVGEV